MSESRRERVEQRGRPRALITGASSGIGAAFAERLARGGHDLVVVARRQERLETLAARLQNEHGGTVEVLRADLTRGEELRAVEERLAEGVFDMLVNNAGFGGYRPFLQLDPDLAEEQIRLHVVALVRLSRAALPGMVARGSGAVINVSSMLAFSAGVPAAARLPQRAVYAGTKAFINAFTELLHGELEGTGVRVQALCPGMVRTEFHQVVGADVSRMPQDLIMEPETVVEASLAALRLDDVICAPFIDDPSLLTQAHHNVFAAGGDARRDVLAPRYATPGSDTA